MSFEFKPATRQQRKARIALDGPSGSGKTFTALLTATQLGERVAVIDTERGSAALYSGRDGFTFDHLDLTTHEPETLVSALAVASTQGYDVVIVDSLSHFWMGVGGMLEQADAAKARDRGPFGGWKAVRPMERRMIEALLAYPGHVIVTMRTKTDWVIERNDSGKEMPRRIGLKAEQRDGIEYEFDVVGDMDLEHTLVISKSRCALLADAVLRRPDEKFARTLKEWLDDGTPPLTVAEVLDQATRPGVTLDEVRQLWRDAKAARLLGAAVMDSEGNDTTLEELLAARSRELTPATPPPSDVRKEVWAFCQGQGMKTEQVEAEFGKWSEGGKFAEATDERLTAFLAHLRKDFGGAE